VPFCWSCCAVWLGFLVVPFKPLAINKCRICPRIQTKVHDSLIVFFCCCWCCWWWSCWLYCWWLFCCLLPPLSIPWERGFCYVVLLLTVGRWSLIAVKSGPSPLFIAKH
jgi:hypothetical protein